MELAILAQPDAYDPHRSVGRVRSTLQRAVDYRRNPRDRGYMTALAEERAPGALTYVDAGPALTDAMIREADRIVLLWPDGNGFGWSPIERRVWRHRRAGVPVTVLNGRRRAFELTPSLWRRYRVRRGVERSWLGEIGFLAAGVVVGLPLVAWDLIRGRT